MKKKIVMAMMLCMCAAAAAGCGQKQQNVTAAETETASETAEASKEETEEVSSEDKDEEKGAKDTKSEPEPEYKALDYVELGQYEGLKIVLASIDVTEEDIQNRYESDCKMSDQMEEITKGTTVEEGDVANIDYEGVKDDEAFDGGTDKGYDLTIGSGTFIEGFEEGLIGKNVGDTVDLNLTFPENYGNTELAGQDVVFHVTINSVKRIPEMTDEVVKELSDYDTVDAYKTGITEELKKEKEAGRESQKISDLYTMLYSSSTIKDYPEEVVDYRLSQMKEFYEELAEQSGMKFADFLSQNFGMTEEDFNKQAPLVIEQGMAQELLLLAVAESEEMTVSDEEYEESLDRYVQNTGSESREALLEQYTEAEIRKTVLMDKALEFIKDTAVEAEESESESETEVSEEETKAETESTAETAEETGSESAETIGGEDGPTSVYVAESETE